MTALAPRLFPSFAREGRQKAALAFPAQDKRPSSRNPAGRAILPGLVDEDVHPVWAQRQSTLHGRETSGLLIAL